MLKLSNAMFSAPKFESPRQRPRVRFCTHYLRLLIFSCCVQARGAKPGKGRLALLKEDNAKFSAPKTRIPTPAPKKKSSALTAPVPKFVSKIPSPKGSSETGGPSSVCTPEPADAAQTSDNRIDAEAAPFAEVIPEGMHYQKKPTQGAWRISDVRDQ